MSDIDGVDGLKFTVQLDAVKDDWDESIDSMVKAELREQIGKLVRKVVNEKEGAIQQAVHGEVAKWLMDPKHQHDIDEAAKAMYKKLGVKHAVFS